MAALLTACFVVSSVLADETVNNVTPNDVGVANQCGVSGPGACREDVATSVGSFATVGMYVLVRGGDGDADCNLDGAPEALTITVTSADTSKATIDTDPNTAGLQSTLTFTACGDPSTNVQNVRVNGVGVTATPVNINLTCGTPPGTTSPCAANTAGNTSNGSFNLFPGRFQVNVLAAPELSITKTDSADPVTAGQNLTYTLTVNNAGLGAATLVAVSDTLPAGTTFVSLSSPPGWTCTTPAAGSGGTISCTNPSLASGNAVLTVVVKVEASVASASVISNTATVSSTPADSNPANDSATTTTTVTTSADLSATKTDAPDPVVAGSEITYSITVSNAGPSDAQNWNLADTLPAGTSLVSITQTSGPPAGGPLPAGASATATLIVKVAANVPSGTVLTNSVSPSSTTPDPNAANNAGTATTTVVTSADVSITKTDSPDPVVASENLTYTVTVSNAGPSDAQTVSWSDTLPSGTTFISLASPAGWTCSTPAVGNSGIVACSRPTVVPGGAGDSVFTLVVKVAASASGTISNTASVTSATSDVTAGNDSDTETTTVERTSDLSVTKDANPTGPVVPGTPITYTLHVTNAGPSEANANALTVIDTLPAGFSNVVFGATSPWTCTISLPTITCTRTGASMPVGTENITFTLTTNPSTTSGNFVNNASVTVTPGGGQIPDPTPGNNAASTSNVVAAPRADVSIAKAISNTVPVPGSNVTYRIRVRNLGPSTAVNVIMTDTLPAGYIFQGWTGGTPTGCTDPGAGTVASTLTCTRSSMLPGTSYLVTFTATVPVSPDGRARNSATVGSSTFDPVQSNNKAVEAPTLP
ncbi:hypothetical protein AYO38_07075 [bacterium SCGC AG-212-C10]|nr:hypothetical protein AYO38_07075 [bacterium SCGC AG-212-C10]